MNTAIVTGGSKGFGLSLVQALVGRGWAVIADARHGSRLDTAIRGLNGPGRVVAVPGDITDAEHRARLIEVGRGIGGFDLLVHNASALGPSPLPPLAEFPLAALEQVYAVNVVAPLALTQLALPLLA
ncbi:MAG: SDR family NAD(P)-dependent oxidoreductase, partial [Nitriliruptorales bacterium]|nr:SDR family NAD(P)-dependent oxidoreductase [Nitriliruptorales bacterium]